VAVLGRRRDHRRMDEIARLLAEQSGLISRRQVLAAGGTTAVIERALRRREWMRLLPGVFIDHTGTPTWQQRAWAGVLFHWPAALGGGAAVRAAARPGWRHRDDAGPIEIAVAVERTLLDVPGYRVRRCANLDERTQWNASPPRVRIEHAALEVASRQTSQLKVIGVLADVCQSRRTTARRILEALSDRERQHDRSWIEAVLTDVAGGTCSVLEHGYLARVERAHDLPRPARQPSEPSDRGPIIDVEYRRFGLLVELDGRLFHDRADQRDRDLDRDLDAAVDGRSSIRLGWGQVFGRPCRSAGAIGRILQARGWSGTSARCGPDCALP
jgi:hypothetical protein